MPITLTAMGRFGGSLEFLQIVLRFSGKEFLKRLFSSDKERCLVFFVTFSSMDL